MQTNRFRVSQTRRSPKAEAIALVILEHAAILNLRRGLLIRDIRSRFSCHESTAQSAVELARGMR